MADHIECQCIETKWTIECQVADVVTNHGKDGRFDIAHVQASLRYMLMIAEKSRLPLP